MEQDRASDVQRHQHQLARTSVATRQIIVDLIGETTTKTGLKITAALDHNTYPTGKKITDAEMDALNIHRCEFQPAWNYSISAK